MGDELFQTYDTITVEIKESFDCMKVTLSEIADRFQNGLDFADVNFAIATCVDEVEKFNVRDSPILEIFDHLKHSLMLE